MATSNIARIVMEIVAEDRGVPVDELKPETRLREDLELDGDDVEELFDAVAERLGPIDLSTFDFHRYFHNEVTGWPWNRAKRNRRPKEPFTLERLIAVARVGKA